MVFLSWLTGLSILMTLLLQINLLSFRKSFRLSGFIKRRFWYLLYLS